MDLFNHTILYISFLQNIGTSKETLVVGSDAETAVSAADSGAGSQRSGASKKKKKKKKKTKARASEG